MTRMTRPDCAVMCNLINTHTYTLVGHFYFYLFVFLVRKIPFIGIRRLRGYCRGATDGWM